MIARIQRAYFVAAVVALTVWPCVQFGITRSRGYSPWILAGWGMYSSPYPLERSVLAIAVNGPCRFIPRLTEASAFGEPVYPPPLIENLEWKQGIFISRPLLISPGDIGTLRERIGVFRAMPSEVQAERVAELLPPAVVRAVVFLQPRFDLGADRAYSEARIFVTRGPGQTVELPAVRTDQVSAAEAAGRELGCVIQKPARDP